MCYGSYQCYSCSSCTSIRICRNLAGQETLMQISGLIYWHTILTDSTELANLYKTDTQLLQARLFLQLYDAVQASGSLLDWSHHFTAGNTIPVVTDSITLSTLAVIWLINTLCLWKVGSATHFPFVNECQTWTGKFMGNLTFIVFIKRSYGS